MFYAFGVAGPGCDFSEEAAVGIRPSALDCTVAHVSSWTRPVGWGGSVVKDHPAVDHVGEASLEGAQGFHRGLAFGQAPSVVRAAEVSWRSWPMTMVCTTRLMRRFPAQEAVAFLVAGGCLDRRGAVPGAKVGCCRIGRCRRAGGRRRTADPVELGQ